MMRSVAVVAACLVLLAVGALALPVISVQNNRLFIDNVEFIVKGIAYSPSPIGQEYLNTTSGYGGTGFCSALITPFNEWKSACYDSDYFSGNPDPYSPNRFPQGFLPIWQRDLPQIKALGLNTIRMYNTNPSVISATSEYTNLYKVPSAGKNHVQFMKYCEQMGIMVIYALFSDEPSYLNLDENVFRRYLRFQIDEVGNSSALLMWQIGNEMTTYWQGRSNNWNTTFYTQKINRMMAYIRTYTKTKWNRFIPVTSTIVNIGTMYNFLYQNWDVDIFTSNVFGTNFDGQFASNSDNSGITALACRYNKPFLMTESGPTWKPGTPYTTGALNQIWADVIKNIPNMLLGGTWFELTDEPAKGKDFGLFSVSVATVNGKRSDQTDVFLPDNLGKKQQWYDAYSGTYNNQQYNYRADVFNTLLKRAPYNALTNNPDSCASKYTLKSCPGSSNPKCSGNGYCDRYYGTCTCLPGWSGTSCNVPSCSCNGRGVCNTYVYPIECACNPGYWGSSCQYAVNPSVCPNLNGMNCTNGNGNCGAGTCYCHPGWTGPDCGVTDPGYSSINVQMYFSGCLQSASFPVTAPTLTSGVTNQKCREYCAIRGYTYAATSNGNTCQCGTTLSTQTTSTSCTSNCAGDATQRCGGSTQFSTYLAGRAWDSGYRGCWPDDSTNRDLPVQMDSGSGSVDTCRNACYTANYAYAAVQNGGQCFCGNFFGQRGAQEADGDCNTPCSNDSTITCGASSLNSVYTAWLPSGYAYYL